MISIDYDVWFSQGALAEYTCYDHVKTQWHVPLSKLFDPKIIAE